MKITKLVLLAASMLAVVSCNNQNRSGKASLDNEIDTISYCFGVSMGNNFKQGGLDTVDPYIMADAISEVYADKETKFTVTQANQILQQYFSKLQQKKAQKNLEEGEAFLEQNKTKDSIQTTESGLQYKIIEEGNGPVPQSGDKVKVDYTGSLVDGTVFDSSVERGQPLEISVDRVIPGWSEALKMMPVGSHWKLYIPADLAYGERPPRGSSIEPNMTLIFDVKLLSIEDQDKTQSK
jgi:FKBP-type peptidyl-prolyl cis-trans isomerase